ncbi:MAG: hypothetical protein I8H87_07065 [Comamonadaceae bacterium]|jgi:hypothetical protein|nr:hypothetical protein [Comamonadaceae bacterium]
MQLLLEKKKDGGTKKPLPPNETFRPRAGMLQCTPFLQETGFGQSGTYHPKNGS